MSFDRCGVRGSGSALRGSGFGVRDVEEIMASYRDLEIYRLSYDLAIRIHNMSLKLPKYEMYEEGGQIRRSSKGIPSCIVEGYGRKKYKAEYVKFLVYAHASCDETILHLNFIKDTHLLHDEEVKSLLDEYDELGRKINKYIKYVENEWK